MSEIVTLELPESLIERVRVFAAHSNRRVEDVLVEWIDRAASEVPVELLPDEQIVQLCNLELTAAEQATLSDLLERQREGVLTEPERLALDALMDTYRRGLVRKAQALKIVVERGLRPPLDAA